MVFIIVEESYGINPWPVGYRLTEEEAQQEARRLVEKHAERWRSQGVAVRVASDPDNHNGTVWHMRDDHGVSVVSLQVYPLRQNDTDN